MASTHRRQSSLPYFIFKHILGKERKCPLEEEAAVLVDSTNSGRPEGIAGHKPRVDRQKGQGHSAEE